MKPERNGSFRSRILPSTHVVRAFVIHWHPDEVHAKCDLVRAAGADVVGWEGEDGKRAGAEVQRLAPDLLVVWLTRLPSHGRVTAAYVRSRPWGRKLPILFVEDGEPLPKEKREALKAAVPGALFDGPQRIAFWVDRIQASLEQAAALAALAASNP